MTKYEDLSTIMTFFWSYTVNFDVELYRLNVMYTFF